VSFPHCEREDGPLMIAWAGYDHLQLARAISAYHADVHEHLGGRDDPRLFPLLACLIELLPWLKQWHNEVDPEFGAPMGVISRAPSRKRPGRWARPWPRSRPGNRPSDHRAVVGERRADYHASARRVFLESGDKGYSEIGVWVVDVGGHQGRPLSLSVRGAAYG